MKKLFLICLAVALSVFASAQRGYFLYLQTDDQSPFYVRMADKIYSSSTAGYLILSNLSDSIYHFGVGFARSTQPETRFAIAINQNDKGYLIKNFTEGLALFDLQELAVVKAATASKDNTVYETKTDRFSSVLSKAAEDPSLLKVPVAKKEEVKAVPEKKEPIVVKTDEPKPETKEADVNKGEESKVVAEAPKDTVATKPAEEIERKVAKNEDSVTTLPQPKEEPKGLENQPETATTETIAIPFRPSTILRRSESSTTEGFGIVYLDRMDDRTDTIRILIPPFKGRLEEDPPYANLSQVDKRSDNTGTVMEQSAEPKREATVGSVGEVKPAPAEQKQKPVVTVANCRDQSSEKDFLKLRKNMAAETNDEAMIEEAKKAFRAKCFSVEQIRYLSTLFLTSAAKYQFFDAAFTHVSDRQNFASLQSEIKDEYYLKRFKALIGE